MYRDMSNSELRRALVQNGVSVGPITERTRNAYETKYANLGHTSSYGQSSGGSTHHSYSTPVRQTQSSYNQYSSTPQTQYYASASRPSVTPSTPVQSMSNSDLRRTLIDHGVRVGPITEKTRNAYETKYLNFVTSSTTFHAGAYSPFTYPSLMTSPKQAPVSPPTSYTKSTVQSMTNAELRQTLVNHGVSVGPITEKTRNAYENKYLNLGTSSAAGESIAQSPSASSKDGDHYVSASPKQTVPSPKQSYSKSSVKSMTNADLRRTLVEHGVGVGPITEKTRKAYENKVLNLGGTSASVEPGRETQAKTTDSCARPAQSPSYTKDAVGSMSNADLRRTLVDHGVGVGPITEKTRKAYEDKVLNLDSASSCPQSPASSNKASSAKPKQQSLPPVKQQSVPSAYEQSAVDKMSNADLRRTLIDHGVRVGPITAKTRKAYENKFLNLDISARNTLDEKDRPVPSFCPGRSFWEYGHNYVLPYLSNNVPQNDSHRTVSPTYPSRSSLVKAADLVRSFSGGDSRDHIQRISCDNNVLKIECTSSPVLTKLNDSRKCKESYDVVLKIDDKEFEAHKTILSAFSPFFEAFFSNRWQSTEASQPSIELKTVEANTMELILDFAYSKSIEISDPDVPAMLEAASFLQVESLLSACCEYLGKCLNAENCLSIDSLAVLFSGAAFEESLLKLHEKARNYAIQNFSAVCQQADFVELESEDLIDIISKDLLNVDKEEVVFEAVLRWLHHNVEDRRLVLNKVLSNVRLVNLELRDLIDRLEREGILELCQEVMGKVIKFHADPNKRSDIPSTIRRYRRSSLDVEVMLVHDLCSETQMQTVGCFDQFGDKMCHLPMPPHASRNIFVATNQIPDNDTNDIKVVARFMYDIWRYDFQLAAWKEITRMLKPRHSFGLCELDGWYAVGGTNDEGVIYGTVERYSLAKNTWVEIAPLPLPVSNPAVVSVNENLLVLGGLKDGDVPCDQVQQFSPARNVWSTITALPVALKCPSACVLDGDVYVGSEDSEKRIFVFNVSSGVWRNCQELPYPILSGPITVNGDVYVLTKNESKSSWIVRHIPSTDSWKEFAIINDFEPQIFSGPLVMKRAQNQM